MSNVIAPEALDPITFEVIRHKLAAISEEQAITLKSASGSPIVTEATDFNNGLYLPDGSIVTMGPQVLFHSGTMRTVIQHINEEFAESPGIAEGDMYILNDPYRGAVHQPDVAVVAPIFHGGRHVAWAGACAHQLDIGGMNFSSWAIKATEVQQEAMLLPGIKLVEGGELRRDLWQMIMGMSRLPALVALDLKAMIAANNVAAGRLGEVMERYGADVVDAVMRAEIAASERQVRERLASLPDATFRAVDYIEHDGHENRLYEIVMTLRKHGDSLTFDMTGTSPQAPGFINCTRAGLIGGVFAGLLPVLVPDIRWNQGILNAVEIVAPPRLLCNAEWPAPVSGGTISTVFVTTSLAVRTVAALVSLDPELAREAAAVTKGSFMVLTLAGLDRSGAPFGTLLMDALLGGGGAYADHDGLDAGGDFDIPRPGVANVEHNEAAGPFRYLYRRFVPDTGGAGRSRGGATCSLAVTPHGVDELHAMLLGHGVEVPNSTGLFGGTEAACNEAVLIRGDADAAAGAVPDHAAAMAHPGAELLNAKPGFFDLAAGDVFAYAFQGGGGFGDAIDRAPEAVLADTVAGMVTPGAAAALYGVVIEAGAVDAAATEAARAAIRRRRLGGAVPPRAPATLPAGGDELAFGPYLVLDRASAVRCVCGEPLAAAGGDWKAAARMTVVAPESHGPHVRLHPELELREHVCPGCGTLLESEVARIGAPSVRSVEVRIGAEAAA